MKRLLILTMMLVFVFHAVGFAAVSSSKPAPAPAKPPTTQQQTAPNSSGYKPSAPASSYSEKAPATAAKPNPQTMPQQQPATGGFLRNMALFGGGMLLGSMLGNMFGFGAGSFFAEMIGALFNVMLLVGVFLGARYLWSRYKESRDEKKRYRDY